MSTTYPSRLSNAEWIYLQPNRPQLPRRGRPRTPPPRRILDAICYVVRAGCVWRYLPSSFPAQQTVYYHVRRFRLRGIWHLPYSVLHRVERERVGRNAQRSAALTDAQRVKTVEESAGISGYDGHKGVKGRTRHLVVDALGLPIAVYVTPPTCPTPAATRRLLRRLAHQSTPELRASHALGHQRHVVELPTTVGRGQPPSERHTRCYMCSAAREECGLSASAMDSDSSLPHSCAQWSFCTFPVRRPRRPLRSVCAGRGSGVCIYQLLPAVL
jgi:transposase